jgi:DNA-binding MarR family transcriptional regulator
MSDSHSGRFTPVAFLLAQVGSGAARQFAKALEPLKFAPSDAGILRLLARSPGISQRELAAQLDMHASRLVGVIDELEKRGLVAREPNAEDRRVYSLHLTDAGREALAAIGAAARAHNEEICAGLSESEREQLAATLEKIAARLGLRPGVHPGYRDLGKRGAPTEGEKTLHAK